MDGGDDYMTDNVNVLLMPLSYALEMVNLCYGYFATIKIHSDLTKRKERRKENKQFQGHSQGGGVPTVEGRWDTGAGRALSPQGRGTHSRKQWAAGHQPPGADDGGPHRSVRCFHGG